MVYHDDVGLLGPLPGAFQETGPTVSRAPAPGPFSGANPAPGKGVPAREIDFAPIARGSVPHPHRGFPQQAGVIHRGAFAAGQVAPAAQA